MAESEIHCTIDLQASAGMEVVSLDWSPYVGWDRVENYLLYRSLRGVASSRELLSTLPGDTYTYEDLDMYCYDQYTYEVIAQGGRGLRSISDTAQGSPAHRLPSIPQHITRVTVENNEFVLVEWDLAELEDAASIVLERNDGNGYRPMLTQDFSDPNIKIQDIDTDIKRGYYTYRLFGIDICGDSTPMGRIGQTIFLQMESSGGVNRLTWTAYEGWPQGVDAYRIETYDAARNQFTTLARVAGNVQSYNDPAFERNQSENCYRLIAEATHMPSLESVSNEICQQQSPRLTAPNAFTPNGDGQNDIFTLQGLFLQQAELQIYNRWGGLVHRTQSADLSWDGLTLSGRAAPEGVYTYVVVGMGVEGTSLRRTGTVHLLR
ncbi:MAG: gliding motility-associated C-terminal domain-containing protein [Bacteroidota bacterium]